MKIDATQALSVQAAPRAGVRRVLLALLGLGTVGAIIAAAVLSRSATDALAELRVRSDVVDVIAAGPVQEAGTEGKDLASGDTVRTDGSGRAQIDFFDRSLVRLDANTQIVLRELSDASEGRRIVVAMGSGRTWNRVAEQRSSSDSYVLRVADATVSVRGTTFFVDCRQEPRCYVVGVDGTSAVASSDEQLDVEGGDCVVVVRGDAPARCNERKLGLLDEWVRENLAEDQLLELSDVTTPSPSPSPTATFRPFVRAPAAPGPAAATAEPTATPEETAKPTEEPEETDAPTASPRKKKQTPPPAPPPENEPTPTPQPGLP